MQIQLSEVVKTQKPTLSDRAQRLMSRLTGKKRPKNVDYVVIELFEEEGDGEPQTNMMTVIDQGPQISILSYEVAACGTPEHWEEIHKLKPGYYRLEYTSCRETETCDGYVIAEYSVCEELKKIKAAPIVGRWLWFQEYTLKPFLYSLTTPFRKVWKLDNYYGEGGGTTSGPFFLPKALWLKFDPEGPWGKTTRKHLHY